ncbi:hypothetical protein, partial [Listeria monocytogenes]
ARLSHHCSNVMLFSLIEGARNSAYFTLTVSTRMSRGVTIPVIGGEGHALQNLPFVLVPYAGHQKLEQSYHVFLKRSG